MGSNSLTEKVSGFPISNDIVLDSSIERSMMLTVEEVREKQERLRVLMQRLNIALLKVALKEENRLKEEGENRRTYGSN